MTQDGTLDDIRADGAVERLLEESWESRRRHAPRRELLSEAGAAAAFLAVAVPLALTGAAAHRLDPGLCLLLVLVYAVVSRTVRFPLGAGYVVPSYLVLVPMLLLLPPGVVPLLVAGGLVLGSLGRWALRQGQAQEMLFSVPDAWHALGPALVLGAAGSVSGATRAVVYVLAFALACLTDLVASTLREWLATGLEPHLQVRVALGAWLFDACLAPLGLALGVAAEHDLRNLLLLVPLGALLLYVERDRTARIARANERLAVLAHERALLQEALTQTRTDPLTGLGNRRALADAFSDARPDHALRTVMILDLDGFKAYNDTQGHPAGDALLQRLARRLEAAVGPDGSAYRLGGDEFCAVLVAGEDRTERQGRVLEAMRESDGELRIDASCGVVLVPDEARTLDVALKLADERMYADKRSRGGGVRARADGSATSGPQAPLVVAHEASLSPAECVATA